MKRKITLQLLTLIMAFQFANAQNTIVVDNNLGAASQYADLQVAIDAALIGDTIYIQPSVNSYGDVVVNKRLNFVGRSHSENNYVGKVDEFDLEPNSSGSYFSGLYIDNRVTIFNTQATTNLVFRNNYINAFSVRGGINGMHNSLIVGNVIKNLGNNCNSCVDFQNTTFTNNIFLTDDISFKYTNITFSNNIILMASNDSSLGLQNLAYHPVSNPTKIDIENCIIVKPAGSTAVALGFDEFNYSNCLSYNEQSSFATLPGTNNLNDTNPQFINVTDNVYEAYIDDYHLNAESPAIGAGTDGNDIGLYNANGYLFNMFGYTQGTPTVKILTITQSVQEGEPLQVTIQAASN